MRIRGFTLIELVITMILTSFLFLGIAGFVRIGTDGYIDAIERQRLQLQARFVVEKLSREISHAIPNSFTRTTPTNQQCLKFFPILFSGFYNIDPSANSLNFFIYDDDTANPVQAFTNGEQLIVNPTRAEDFEGADSTAQSITTSTTCPAASVSTTPCTDFITKDEATAVGSTNFGFFSFVNPTLASQSVASRLYIYDPTSSITYCVNNDTNIITRQTGSGAVVQVADNVTGQNNNFTFDQLSLQQGGLVHLDLTFTRDTESSDYKHNIRVLNVP